MAEANNSAKHQASVVDSSSQSGTPGRSDDEALYLGVSASEAEDLPVLQQAVVSWIRDNQTLAMIVGFAVGVFVGSLLRD